jgi:HK97 gp10 family phage protein
MPTKIVGLDRLQKSLSKVLTEVQTQTTIEAITLGAEMMQGAISMRAPVRTGELAGSIEFELKYVRKVVTALVGPSKEGFYGRFLEFGTKFMPARPFMRPALDEESEKIIRAMGDYMTEQFAIMRSV